MVVGVGIVGAGPGVAALHLPTLARIPEAFRCVAITDGGSGRAAALAARTGAAVRRDVDALLADQSVQVVAVCSPPQLHADHVRRSLAAGIRAILCEKPLATTVEEARSMVESARAAGVPLIVGTNHRYDPAWQQARRILADAPARNISVSIALPPNERYHQLVTEADPAAAAPGRGAPDWRDRNVAASVVRQLVLGLAVHDLPAIRELAPEFERVDFARPVPPIGYLIGLRASGIPIQLSAVMLPAGPAAHWRLSLGTDRELLDLDYPPAFVHGGAGTVRVRSDQGQLSQHPVDRVDGYVREWLALADQLADPSSVPYDQLLDDALFAVAVADGARDAIRGAA